ncbi:autotransporter domain-containing protein [Sutterella wadsworthensis]|uniref:autotransporter domain-containing protein n=1 Tax=Sutterella wadsworthensis TaxID=40545 RepID=UPI003966EF2D
MNRTYKVAKSLTRGVVVTSEKASSYQGKAVKTVVAAAVSSLLAGVAMAADTATSELDPANTLEITTGKTVTIKDTTFGGSSTEQGLVNWTVNGGTLTVDTARVYHKNFSNNTPAVPTFEDEASLTINSGKVVISSSTAGANIDVNQLVIKGGEVSLKGAGEGDARASLGAYGSFEMTGGTVNINEHGNLWFSTDSRAGDDANIDGAMILTGGTINLAGGQLAAGDSDDADVMSLAGTAVNVTAKDSVIKAYQTKQSAGAVVVTKDGVLTVKSGLSNSNDASYQMTGGTFDVAEGGSASFNLFLDVDGGKFTNSGTVTIAGNGELTVGGTGVFTNSGKGVLKADTITIEENGVLNTTYTQANFQWKNITVADNGVLNLDALNSRHDEQKIGTEDKDGNVLAGDRLLINEGTINLNGGELQVAGTKYEGDLKIGRQDKTATLNIDGDYSFAKVEFGYSNMTTSTDPVSSINVKKNGSLTIADLDLTYGVVTVNDGSTLTLGTVSAVDTGTLTNNGYLLTGISNLVKDGEATTFTNALSGDGSVVETSITGEYTLKDLQDYTKLLTAKGQEFIIKNGTLAKNADGSNHTLSDVDGLVVFNSTVTNSTTTASVTKDTTVGALAFTGNDVKGKDVTISGNLQLTGVNGEIITGVDADKTITINSTVNDDNDGVMFGAEDDDLFSFAPVSVNNKVSVSDDSQLTTNGTVTFAKAVELNTSGKIEALNGVFTFDSIKGGSVYNNGGSVIVKNAPAAATGKSTAADTVTYDKAFALDTQYAGNNGAFFTFGQNKASKASTEALIRQYADLAADAEIGASLYVSERYDLANGGIALGAASASTTKGTLSAAQGSYIVLDMGSIASKNYDPKTHGVFQGVTSSTVSGTILLTDLTADGFVKDEKTGNYSLDLGTNVTPQGTVITDADFYTVAVSGSTVTLSADQDELDYLKDLGMNNAWLVEHDIKEMTNSGNFFANALIYGNEALDAYYDKADAEWAKIAEAANIDPNDENTAQYKAYWAAKDAYVAESEIVGSNMAVFGGAFTTALDVNDQVTAAVSRRTSAQRAEGFTPWVDVFGTTNEAKRLYGNGAGYEADIYGAVLGFDYTAACGGTLGVAFNVGQADSNSVGTGVKVDNDADFYGFSLYGAQTFGDFNVKADLGYTQISNDLSSTGAFGTVKESLDSNVFTFGLGTEYLAKFGALNITPHAGIRLSRIDMDDSLYGADYDTMTVYQLPLGVAFSGNFDVNGWKLAPMVDLSVVPAFGDKDAVATYTGGIQSVTRVVDTNPIQATLGVSAQNGAWTFGLNYGLTAGGDDRMNNAFNANLRYSF